MKKERDRFACALVTGASLGIGNAVSRLLADKGIPLIIVARSTDKLEQLAEELRPKVDVEVLSADLSNKAARNKVVEAIRRRQPDLIVNNAGWGLYGEALTHETEEFLNMLEVDVAAVMELTLEGARTLVANGKHGVIMNISSAAGIMPVFPGFSVYAASKAFLNVFSQSLNAELRPYGISVLASCPGVVDTHFRSRAADEKKYQPNPYAMPVDFAALEIWKQIVSRKPLHVFDWKYRWSMTLARYLVPTRLLAHILANRIAKLHSPRKILRK